jgi:tRNA modification GTPase
VRTAEILLEQSQGALDREIALLVKELRAPGQAARQRLDRLIERGRVGLRLITGWRVVIAGRPNVGKSRLLNALAGYHRAIVHPTPGTTRDVVTVKTAFDGWPIELADTAGFRATTDAVEQSGIDRALRQTETADLVLKVLDRSEPLHEDDHLLINRAIPSLLVANKADLPVAWDVRDLDPALAGSSVVVVSAERGDGLDLLIATIVSTLVSTPPEPGAGVPFRPEQMESLERAREALHAGDSEKAIQELDPEAPR